MGLLTLRDVEEVPLVAVFSFSGAEVVLVAAYLEGCGGGASCGRVQLQWCRGGAGGRLP